MNKRTSRTFWLVTAALAFVATGLLFISPSLYAQDISSFEEERLLRTFRQVFDFIQDNYVDEVDPDVLIEGAMKGMFDSLEDPYSAYLDTNDMRSLTDTTSGQFGGVGLYINKVLPDEERPELQEWVEVVSPIEGTPAYRAGMRPRDLIVEIEGESTVEMSIDEVVSRLRGEPGSDVVITVQRGSQRRFNVTLTRAIIEIPTVRYAGVGDDVGYIRIIQFTPRTAEKTEEAILDLKNQGFRDLIIDLRTNPGGLLTAAIDTADLFFDDGLVVGTAGRVASENQAFFARQGRAVDGDVRVVVMINEGTASAAEILAGALRDRDRAVLVGVTSFGKGSVQQVRSLGNGGFRLTMARYYTPDEIFIDKVGIEPDVVIEEPEILEEESESLIEIQNEKLIEAFLDRNNNVVNDARINGFINSLRADGYAVNERLLVRLINLELSARLNENPVYDLEYDLVLQEALEIIRSDRVQAIIDEREEPRSMSSTVPRLPSPRLP
jgi:carboxyl-terminal processing protease